MNFFHKFTNLLKFAVNTGETHIRYRIEGPQFTHHALAQILARHFAIVLVGDLVSDAFCDVSDGLLGHGTLLAGAFDAREKFVLGEKFTPTIALHDEEFLVLNFLVSGEAVRAAKTFAASPDDRAFFGGAGINDLVIQPTALRTPHNSFSNPQHNRLRFELN